jgi:16S rRNA (uracil1498-N3)-methyltransferase
MNLPYFYISSFEAEHPEIDLEIDLDEDNSRHVVQVLRMEVGQEVCLTDGKGALLTAGIVEAHKKKCRVTVRLVELLPPPARKVTVAISPLKNASRLEWFLEKATEIGIAEIIPLITDRTGRQHLRSDRLHNILVSALLQSQQAWLPVLRPAIPFAQLLEAPGFDRRLIAWMEERSANAYPVPQAGSTLILIGPEGDFTPEEAAAALARKYIPVTLGKNRLRTETAGVVAATLLCIG